MRREFTLPITGIALMALLTGCKLMPNNEAAEPSPAGVTSVAQSTEPTDTPSSNPSTSPPGATPAPTPTATATAPPAYIPDPPLRSEYQAELKRAGLYNDEWAESVGIFFQQEANIFRGSQQSEYGDSLQSILDYLAMNEVPERFEVTYEATVGDNFIVKVWHPDAYTYYSEQTAYEGRSDPLAPAPTPSEEELPALEPIDTDTTELLYDLVVSMTRNENENNGELLTDADVRAQGLVPQGWEWSVEQSPSVPEHRITRLWHPGGQIFNTEETAAYRDTFPKEDRRPDYNFDIDPLIPIIDAQPPRNYTPFPSESPTPIPTSSQEAVPTLPTPEPSPTPSDGPA